MSNSKLFKYFEYGYLIKFFSCVFTLSLVEMILIIFYTSGLNSEPKFYVNPETYLLILTNYSPQILSMYRSDLSSVFVR